MAMKLSEAARVALINAAPRQGALVQSSRAALAELKDEGLVSVAAGGLTRRGLIERQRLADDALDAAFGAL